MTANLPLSGYFTSARFARGHAVALGGFRSALNQAKAWTAQLGTVRSALGTLPGMSARDAALVTIGQYPTFLSVGQVQRVADLMYGTGMIHHDSPEETRAPLVPSRGRPLGEHALLVRGAAPPGPPPFAGSASTPCWSGACPHVLCRAAREPGWPARPRDLHDPGR